MKTWIIRHDLKQILVKSTAPMADLTLARISATNHGYELVYIL